MTEADTSMVVPEPATDPAPSVPRTLDQTGLGEATVIELLLKALYAHGRRTGQRLANAVRLPFSLIDEPLGRLQRERLVEVHGAGSLGRGGYGFELTGAGRERAREAMSASQYVGPAPVPLEQYRRQLMAQSITNTLVRREELHEGFSHLVMDEEQLDLLGPAVNSARSIFLHGRPGNGKTLIAETLARLLGGAIYVPYAVLVEGQVIVVHDPVHHRPARDGDAREGTSGREADPANAALQPRITHDPRFVRCRRPVVMTGGELTLDQLDLQYDPYTRMYQAPFQVKANGGVLIIDDFGRQRVPPRELLNRWIVPLEKRIDFLTLHTGTKFPVPFDCLLAIATNLDPSDLVEEAFLRRIHYKIHIGDPSREEYEEIFRRACAARGIEYDPAAVDRIYMEVYDRGAARPRRCHPRDLLDHVEASARFLGADPRLTAELIDRATHSYFLIENEQP